MPITTSTLKKYLNTLTEAELRAELIKLFGKLEQVKAYYGQELATKEERVSMLTAYKKELYGKFWTKGGSPKVFSNAEIKKVLTDFEKISLFPHELVDLILYRVELLTKYANAYGGVPDSEYNPAITAFGKAVKLMRMHKLDAYFKERIEVMFKANNLDYWYIEQLEEIYEDA
jgi:hypothetical protein